MRIACYNNREMRPKNRSRPSLLWTVGILGSCGRGQGQQLRCPCVRSTPWDSLSNNHQAAAQTLGYQAESWDMRDFGKARVESRRWTSLSPERQEAAQTLGYAASTWDCCINHYEAYEYEELQLQVPLAHAAIVSLGYSKPYWNGPEWRYDPPRVEAKTWCTDVTSEEEDVCVNPAEIDALRTLCYSPSRFRDEPLSGPGADGAYVGYDYC